MGNTELLKVIHEVELLEGFDIGHLQRIASIAELVRFPENTVIFRQGDPAEKILIIVSGTVALEICASGIGCRRIQTLMSGELLGWSGVLEQPRLSATARTMTATEAIELAANDILNLCETDPELGYHFMRRVARTLSHRLNAVRMQLLDVYGPEASPK